MKKKKKSLLILSIKGNIQLVQNLANPTLPLRVNEIPRNVYGESMLVTAQINTMSPPICGLLSHENAV